MPTAVITGSNSGIGYATAVGLARAGFEVVLAVRNQTKGEDAAARLRVDAPGASARVMPLDLASLASVRSFGAMAGEHLPRIDVLVNNAGVILRHREVTADGFEMTFGVNHLGHFLLTNLLAAPLASAEGTGRVVVVASNAEKGARDGLDFDDLQMERRKFSVMRAYSTSKLANLLFTRELAKRWQDRGVTINAVHPGFVATNIARDGDGGKLGHFLMGLVGPIARSPEKGARTSIRVATSPALAGVTGKYFYNEQPKTPSPRALDDAAAARLWDVSAALVGLDT